MSPEQARNPLQGAQQALTCDVRVGFSRAFSLWRKKHNVPLKQVAADLGISIATVSAWETGRRFPTGAHFQLLADYTGVPPCRLFCVMSDRCISPECMIEHQKAASEGLPGSDRRRGR